MQSWRSILLQRHRLVASVLCALAFDLNAAEPVVSTGSATPPVTTEERPAGQPATPPPANALSHHRTRIGLVLSGGGARGAAHVGVIKALERLRIPIDFIAGTSMGSIVGAAYASGSTVEQMEQAITGITTDALFRDQPPRQAMSFRRKQDDYLPLMGAEFGVANGSLSLPKGAVSGVALESVLRRLVRSQGQSNFDQLPIPFRAIATDIETGKMVVFRRGELAAAMRASMSVPGAIAPAEIDGRMLVDGGLVRNLPIDVVREMGADLVIAVNLGTPLLKRDQITSVLGVSAQMINILTEQNVQASLATLTSEDVLVSPALGEFSAGDFDHLGLTIPIGEAAVQQVADRLRAFSLSPADYAAVRARQTSETLADGRVVDEVRLNGLSRVNPQVIAAQLELAPGNMVKTAQLDDELRRLYGRGDFERVNYSFIEENGRQVLAIDSVEKAWGPDYVRFGLGLSTDFSGDSWFNLLGTHRRTWLNSLGAEWRNEFQVGRIQRLMTEFYQPLDVSQRFFVAPQLKVEQRPVDYFVERIRVARFSALTSKASVDLGSQFTRYGELRLGLERGVSDYRLDTGPSNLDATSARVQTGGVNLRLRIDQLDNVVSPRQGYSAGLNVYNSRQSMGATNDYTRWEGSFMGATAVKDHVWHLALRAGGRIGANPLPDFDSFSWGGFLQQSGYRTGQLLGRELAFGRLVYQNRLVKLSFLEGVYAGVSFELGHVRDPVLAGPTGLLKSGSLFLTFDSPIGPLYVAYGQSADGNRAGYLYLGRPF